MHNQRLISTQTSKLINISHQVLQDVKPTIAELHQQQEQHAAAYPLTVVVPPEIILRTALGDHVLETNDKSAEDSKEKERLREGNILVIHFTV